MPWLQFFDDEDNVIREFKISQQANVGLVPEGCLVTDPQATDYDHNPRILVVRHPFAYAKTISEPERAKQGDSPEGGVLLESPALRGVD